jgi:hypothetical protein
VLHDWDGYAASNLPRLLPISADFTDDGNLNLASTLVGYPPNEEAPNLVPWSSTFAEFPINGRNLNLMQLSTASEEPFAHGGTFVPMQPSLFVEYFPRQDGDAVRPYQPTLWLSISPEGELTAASATTEPKPRFDFGYTVLTSAVEALADYISESERKARELWRRFYRKNILSSAVSKDGHLSFLIASYRKVCVETAARDHVVHLEVITLAEEQEAPGTSAVGQMLISGGKSWKSWKNRLSSLFSEFLPKTLSSGFVACGLSFECAEPLTHY